MSSDTFRVMNLPRKEIIKIFRALPAPSLEEMDGEFRATLLDQGRWAHNFCSILAFNLPGAWIAKSFAPVAEESGCGYNVFRVGTKTRRIFRMNTYVGDSKADGNPSFHLDYQSVKHQESMPKFTNLAGEVRKLGPSRFLGVGTADFRLKICRREQPFLLEGPVGPYNSSVSNPVRNAA